MNYKVLRKKYPKFVFEKYSWKISKNKLPRPQKDGAARRASLFQRQSRLNNLEIFFSFRITPDIFFQPKIIIENIDKKRLAKMGESVLDNFVFHLGLIEIPSYWKATCSPKIEIKAGKLNSEQIKWWHNLMVDGMGQFFYENKIDWRKSDFLKIIAKKDGAKSILLPLKNKYLVPIGGGRDGIVTLELLKKKKKEINAFLVNPTKAAKNVVKVARIKNPIIVKRIIDKKLLELNKKGFLNGHTPFTSVLSFLAVFCGVLFDYKNIVFSLESSANEGNVKYLGKMINHQWAKSSEFEKRFKIYCKKYLAKNINYFSLLRQYSEVEISKIFLRYQKYFSIFSSCNAGIKLGKRWCGNCPKCLFVYATFYPFLDKKQLLKIFGKDIFENKKLLPVMKDLIGEERSKPFECVGTKKESRLIFYQSLKKAEKTGKLPYLLTKLK